MRYQVSGKQIDIGAALQDHVRDALEVDLGKFSVRPQEASIVFSRQAHEFACEITLHLSTGLIGNATGKGGDAYAAFEAASDKLGTQMRRYKRRLKSHHRDRTDPVELSEGASYILASSEGLTGAEPDSLQPIIIAEMETTIPSLSVGEAVMQMELAGASVLVFRSEGDNGVNVVYRRDDGNVGWIDPQNNG